MVIKKTIVIIPARGNSKGIPHKNIAMVCGKPLIAYTINCAIKSGIFDRIIISTDDSKIAAISKKYGAEVIKRPSELAQDNTQSLPVLKHALGELRNEKYVPDFVYMLQPTSPLRHAGEIININRLMQTGKYNGVVAVTNYDYKPPLILGKNNEILFLNKSDPSKRRQDFGKLYRVTGSIYSFKTDFLLSMKKNLFEKKVFGFVTSELTSIDIDTDTDLKIAEALLKNKQKHC